MEKLRFIADTDWQSNVDGRPSISLQIAFTIPKIRNYHPIHD